MSGINERTGSPLMVESHELLTRMGNESDGSQGILVCSYKRGRWPRGAKGERRGRRTGRAADAPRKIRWFGEQQPSSDRTGG